MTRDDAIRQARLARILRWSEWDAALGKVKIMGTTFGIPMTEPTKKHEGYEDYMVRRLRETEQPDMVNSPPHYSQGSIECIDAMKAALGAEGFRAYCRGNVLKYVWRTGSKERSTGFRKGTLVSQPPDR